MLKPIRPDFALATYWRPGTECRLTHVVHRKFNRMYDSIVLFYE